MKKNILIIILGLAMAGCASSGRFAAVDINGWKPDQMKANEEEAKIVYTANTAKPNGAQPDEASTSEIPKIGIIGEVIEAIKGLRIRIFSVEWKK